ncbi:HNH endonuclease signature motif containing protein [Nocardioides mangrovi]|uniref:HNH endonuclease n=1 Tax=Nocardioides mangrovi TaxID=2874580 RepID=A0ABS7UDY2_9ACTN|nr:HNH endonuclease signature motif containing protein [Nocardioides mangrovi]MBZ5738992.1 HNH endonuclease [Nocardioides mangrovi]
MTAAAIATPGAGPADPAKELLRELDDNLALLLYAEARQLEIAVEWVRLHPGDEVDISVPYGDRDLPIAGDGAPTIAEFAIADFALTLGISTDAARALLGDAVEIHHRLPELWERLVRGDVRVWKARKVAQSTRALSMEAAAYVDHHVARVAHRCSLAQVERTVERAKAELDPEALEADRQRHADDDYVRVHTDDLTTTGKVHIDALVDAPVALAFDQVVNAKAHELFATHPDLSLDQRRALALGQLGKEGSTTEIVLYAHTRPDNALVEVDNTRSVITTEELVEWCSLAGAALTVKPVIDLNAELVTHRYTPTGAQQEQAILLNPTCVFPHCTRPSRGCDLDHIVEWPLGPTIGSNLAPLCRGHHRLKTHSDWTYTRTGPTSFVWTSPTGRRHLS